MVELDSSSMEEYVQIVFEPCSFQLDDDSVCKEVQREKHSKDECTCSYFYSVLAWKDILKSGDEISLDI